MSYTPTAHRTRFTFRRSAMIAVASLALLAPSIGAAGAATDAQIADAPSASSVDANVDELHVFTPAEMSDYPTIVGGVEFSGEAWKALSAKERADLFNILGEFGRSIEVADPGEVQANFYPGWGRYIYIHDLSPSDQRWILQMGPVVVGAAVCAAAPAACPVAGVIAAGMSIGAAEYAHPTCWITLVFNYNGTPVYSKTSIDHC